jgi:SAM-dependent methyltransferase
MKCRHCHHPLELIFLDLGVVPPSNAYLGAEALTGPEPSYPLRVMVCSACWLVQTEDFADAHELFTRDYGYFSATSHSWVEHCRRFIDMAVERFGLGKNSKVVEVAANDGYLLQFVKARGIDCVGIEPTHATAEAARARGINIIEAFFGEALAARLAGEGHSADLTIANNVLAHVPDINDFVAGFRTLLKPNGVACFEFPHLLKLVQGNQFDTVYHEHFSYLSLTTTRAVFEAAGLSIFDVKELPTHGGSLRIFAERRDTGCHPVTANVARILDAEKAAGVDTTAFYSAFQSVAMGVRNGFIDYLRDCRRRKLSVAAYGAAAKANTLLNFAGIRSDLIPFVVDRSPGKVGRWMPGSHIAIVTEERLRQERPDRIVILPWNLREEISAQLQYAREWGAKFVVAVPELYEW